MNSLTPFWRQHKLRIYIIGMPGSGKTTISKKLSEYLNIKYIDLDYEIEFQAKMFIEEIFYRYGEQKFRELETEALKEIKDNDAVIACGGGIVLNPNHQRMMDGLVIYLDTDLDIIKSRLKDDYQRPLLKVKPIELIDHERKALYIKFSHIIVKNNTTIDETIKAIIAILKEREII